MNIQQNKISGTPLHILKMTEEKNNDQTINELLKTCSEKLNEQVVQVQMIEIIAKQSQQQSKSFSKLHKKIPKDSKFNVYYEAKYHLESTTYQNIQKFDSKFKTHVKNSINNLKINSKIYKKDEQTYDKVHKKFISLQKALTKTQTAVTEKQNLYDLEPNQKVEEMLKKLQSKEKEQINLVNAINKQDSQLQNKAANTGIDFLNKLQKNYQEILKFEKQFYELISDFEEIKIYFDKLKELNAYALNFDADNLSANYLQTTLKLSPNMEKIALTETDAVATPILPNFEETMKRKKQEEEEERLQQEELKRQQEEELKRQQEEEQARLDEENRVKEEEEQKKQEEEEQQEEQLQKEQESPKEASEKQHEEYEQRQADEYQNQYEEPQQSYEGHNYQEEYQADDSIKLHTDADADYHNEYMPESVI